MEQNILLRIDDFGTYLALFRKTGAKNDIVLCETLKNSYWERAKGEWTFWAMGKAQVVPCNLGKACLNIEIVKSAPLFSGEVVEFSEAPIGNLKQTPEAPVCN